MQKSADRKPCDPDMFETGLPYVWAAVFVVAFVFWSVLLGVGAFWLWHHIDWQGVIDFMSPTALQARELGAAVLIEAAQ